MQLDHSVLALDHFHLRTRAVKMMPPPDLGWQDNLASPSNPNECAVLH